MCIQYAPSFYGSSPVHRGSLPPESPSPRWANAAGTHSGVNVRPTHADVITVNVTCQPPSLPPSKQPTAACLCCSSRAPGTTFVTMVTAAAASSWTRRRRNSGPRTQSENTRQWHGLMAHKWSSVTRRLSQLYCALLCPLLTCHTPMLAAGGEKGLRNSLQIL